MFVIVTFVKLLLIEVTPVIAIALFNVPFMVPPVIMLAELEENEIPTPVLEFTALPVIVLFELEERRIPLLFEFAVLLVI